MAYKLIYVCGAFGVAFVTLALVVMAAFGLAVWLGGSDWARRSERPRG